MKNNKEHYENGTKFKFISTIGEHLGKTLTALNKLVFGVIEAKPYVLDWEQIKPEYQRYLKEKGRVDIDEFCFNYVVGHSLVNKFADNDALKEAMYLHLRAELLAKKVNEELN